MARKEAHSTSGTCFFFIEPQNKGAKQTICERKVLNLCNFDLSTQKSPQ